MAKPEEGYVGNDEDAVEQAYRYWHDCGFDEGYQVGYEDGVNDEMARQEKEEHD